MYAYPIPHSNLAIHCPSSSPPLYGAMEPCESGDKKTLTKYIIIYIHTYQDSLHICIYKHKFALFPVMYYFIDLVCLVCMFSHET